MPDNYNRTIQRLPVNLLLIDERYQRNLSGKHVEKLFSKFNPLLLTTLLVSDRKDGFFYVLDGQHRRAVLIKKRIEYADCEVWQNLTVAQEASIFEGVNRDHHIVSAYDSYKARIFIEDKLALQLQRIARDCHVIIAPFANNNMHTFTCVHTIEYVLTTYGERILWLTFDFILNVWPEHRVSRNQTFMYGVGRFLYTYGNVLERRDVLNKMQSINPQKLMMDCRSMVGNNQSGLAMAKILAAHYNSGRRSHFIDERELLKPFLIKKVV